MPTLDKVNSQAELASYSAAEIDAFLREQVKRASEAGRSPVKTHFEPWEREAVKTWNGIPSTNLRHSRRGLFC
ncbi:MAG: hypothetical protein ACRD1R_15290 [Acidobacteriota bacterium]